MSKQRVNVMYGSVGESESEREKKRVNELKILA